LLNRRGSGILPPLEQFRNAVELDPDYVLAWARIADAYTVSAYFGLIKGDDARPHGIAAARRILALDPLSAEANASVACALLVFEDDRERAARGFVRALELNPSYVEARRWYALFYLQWSMGRFDEGIAEARKALEVDPLSSAASLEVLTLRTCTI
jgi:adenylate cyclase